MSRNSSICFGAASCHKNITDLGRRICPTFVFISTGPTAIVRWFNSLTIVIHFVMLRTTSQTEGAL